MKKHNHDQSFEINLEARAISVSTWPYVLPHFELVSLSGSRLSPLTTPPCERSPQMTLSLQEILIVGSTCEQAKFSELTMDMFRMLQTLEREPQEGVPPLPGGHITTVHDASPATSRMPPYGSMPGSKGTDGSIILIISSQFNLSSIFRVHGERRTSSFA